MLLASAVLGDIYSWKSCALLERQKELTLQGDVDLLAFSSRLMSSLLRPFSFSLNPFLHLTFCTAYFQGLFAFTLHCAYPSLFFVPGLVYTQKVKLTQLAISQASAFLPHFTHRFILFFFSFFFFSTLQCGWPAIAVASRARPGIALHSYSECCAATLLPSPHPDLRM